MSELARDTGEVLDKSYAAIASGKPCIVAALNLGPHGVTKEIAEQTPAQRGVLMICPSGGECEAKFERSSDGTVLGVGSCALGIPCIPEIKET